MCYCNVTTPDLNLDHLLLNQNPTTKALVMGILIGVSTDRAPLADALTSTRAWDETYARDYKTALEKLPAHYLLNVPVILNTARRVYQYRHVFKYENYHDALGITNWSLPTLDDMVGIFNNLEDFDDYDFAATLKAYCDYNKRTDMIITMSYDDYLKNRGKIESNMLIGELANESKLLSEYYEHDWAKCQFEGHIVEHLSKGTWPDRQQVEQYISAFEANHFRHFDGQPRVTFSSLRVVWNWVAKYMQAVYGPSWISSRDDGSKTHKVTRNYVSEENKKCRMHWLKLITPSVVPKNNYSHSDVSIHLECIIEKVVGAAWVQ